MFLYFIEVSCLLEHEKYLTLKFMVDTGCVQNCILTEKTYSSVFGDSAIKRKSSAVTKSKSNTVNIMGQKMLQKIGFIINNNQGQIASPFISIPSDD